ncbi:phosphatase PAP2 family protein [Bosea sp. BIWAKO-01]|uniref:phosphatase PAP2 family protein n=1 Tax=Bosea sp. BIWAKO-01 TaxID=506668 RepID=UPI00159EFDAD|nr:phosphatase PAP2 family protein [Bosea sp. BIWAKO-01]
MEPASRLAPTAFAVAVLGLCFLAGEMIAGDLARLDMAVLAAFRSAGDLGRPLGPPWLQEAGRDITALGSFAFLGILFAATVGYLILIGRRDAAKLVSVTVIGGAAVSAALQLWLDRPGPDGPYVVFTANFPSEHATLSAMTFLTLGAVLSQMATDRRVRAYLMALAIILTVAVGLSRIYLGVHYPSDVLAGWCIGSVWAALCWTLGLRLQQRRDVQAPAAVPAES